MLRNLFEILSLSASSFFSSFDLLSIALRRRRFLIAVTSLGDVLGSEKEINLGKTRSAGCGACYVGETNRHLATRDREHFTSDKNSHIFQHINGSEACRSLCSEDCFSILDTASTSFQLKIKEALHIGWEKPSLNKQVNHVNLTLSL